jgi:hypothetical protein
MDEFEDLLNFPKVETGNGYANNLTATTNDRLERTVKASVVLAKTYMAEGRQTRHTIRVLKDTIKDLDTKNSKLQKTILCLTIVMVITSIIQIVSLFCN